MYKLILISLVILSVGCASTTRENSISLIGLAYANFQDGNYENTLLHIIQVEQGGKITDEQKAELIFLKAQTYDEMGQRMKAEGLYEYLKEEHSSSQYGYLASKLLESNN